MTATNQSQQAVFVVDDDDSVRLSLSNLSIGWLAG
jgi:FixJ family two-component response regulator